MTSCSGARQIEAARYELLQGSDVIVAEPAIDVAPIRQTVGRWQSRRRSLPSFRPFSFEDLDEQSLIRGEGVAYERLSGIPPTGAQIADIVNDGFHA